MCCSASPHISLAWFTQSSPRSCIPKTRTTKTRRKAFLAREPNYQVTPREQYPTDLSIKSNQIKPAGTCADEPLLSLAVQIRDWGPFLLPPKLPVPARELGSDEFNPMWEIGLLVLSAVKVETECREFGKMCVTLFTSFCAGRSWERARLAELERPFRFRKMSSVSHRPSIGRVSGAVLLVMRRGGVTVWNERRRWLCFEFV